ncbi:MAG: HD domain-containing protein [Candidatus Eisenbacteria bacterium]|uniref:HD domain-containing protein n=1 Tax=Eiseniibacteriota bacterium TaxID=2212470 RepID=A0A933SD07_UNCEI|nr:HD domain-containing protein [Candidatus Eisenbacteria bacterium]
MTTPDPHTPAHDDALAEHATQVSMRLVALLRTARSYQLGNQALTTQIDHFLGVLQAAFADHGEIQLLDHDGDLHFNGVRIPLRATNLRFLEQLQQEFHAREINGVVFVPGLDRDEFESFMRFFLATDAYKGMELFGACEAQGITRVFPAFAAVEAEAVQQDATAVPELAQSYATYQQALHLVEALAPARSRAAGIELRHLKRVVQPLVDTAVAGTPDPSQSALDGQRLTASEHALQVSLVAIRTGAQLGLDRAALAELGAVALLHDTGKSTVAAGVPVDAHAREAGAEARAREHVLAGVRAIAGGNALHESSLLAMRVALEHHAFGPNAYPTLPEGHQRSPLSEIVAIADAYVCLRFSRDKTGAFRTPSRALATVLGPLGPAFDPAVRAALVRALGLYPPGQIVVLDDGALAIVLATSPATPDRPQVEWLTGAAEAPLPADQPRPAGALPEGRHVVRALTRAEWPFAEPDAA